MVTLPSMAFFPLLLCLSVQQPVEQAPATNRPIFTDAVYSQLNLNQSQRNSIRKLERQYERRLRSLGPASAETVQAVLVERASDVKCILTPEQWKRWRQLSPNELPYAEMPMLPAHLNLLPMSTSEIKPVDGTIPKFRSSTKPVTQ